MWCILIAMRVVCQSYVNNKRNVLREGRFRHLLRPSVLAQSAGQIFFLRHPSLSLMLEGNSDFRYTVPRGSLLYR